MTSLTSGAEGVARALVRGGVHTVYTLSGNQVLPLYDALLGAGIRLIATRHEAAAVHMADAAAQLTGQTTVVLVTAGPGHVNALTALGTARLNESPVLLLSGAAAVRTRESGAFQDLPQAAMAAPVTKWSGSADDPAQAGGLVEWALNFASAEVPGPISLSLPHDVQIGSAGEPAVAPQPLRPDWVGDDFEPLLDVIRTARQPILLGSPWVSRRPEFRAVAEALECPAFAIESARAASDPFLFGADVAFREADLIVLLAPGDFAVRTEQIGQPRRYGVVQVWPENPPAGPPAGVTHLRGLPTQALQALLNAGAPRISTWAERVSSAQTEALDLAARELSGLSGDGVHPLRVAQALRRRLSADDVVCMDGGEFVQWVRFGLAQGPWRSTVNGKFGPVGPGFPSALGARAALGDGPSVVAVAGDGGFGYHAMEIETAAREGLPVVAIVGTDGKWAAEWHLQERHYGADRRVGTELLRSHFEQMAEALGGCGVLIRDEAEIEPALDTAWQAMRSGRPVVVNVFVAPIPSPAALH